MINNKQRKVKKVEKVKIQKLINQNYNKKKKIFKTNLLIKYYNNTLNFPNKK